MIFNKDNNGAEEIQTLVGIYFQSNDFGVIESEIKSASVTIRRLIDTPIFERAENHYHSAAYDDQKEDVDTQLVKNVQATIAQLAMVRFYQQNILSHEDGGRKVKIHEESEKMPWQWQYDRDDQALLDKYYRTLDELYNFLEESGIEEWKASPLRQKLAECFIKDIDAFQSVFPIEDSSRMFYLLVPFMLEVQERVIRPIVGEEAFEQMKSGTIPEKLSEQFAAAKLCIPLYAIITAVKRMSVKVLPSMIVRRFSDSFQGGRGGDIDDSTTRKFLHTLQQEALDAKTELQKAVTDRRNPARDVALIPNNDPTKKFCST